MSVAELYLGDCIRVMSDMKSDCIDLGFTSPPYYNAKEYATYASYQEYLDFLKDVSVQVFRLLKPGRIWVVNLSPVIQERTHRQSESVRLPIPFHYVGIAESVGFKFIDDIIWEKPLGSAVGRGRGFDTHRQPVAYKPNSVTEYLLVFKKGDSLLDGVIRSHSRETRASSLVNGEYDRSNVWKINPENHPIHPAPFPIELAKRVIRYYSFVGDVVMDCFMGIGTTIKASVLLNRAGVGIERNQEYFEIAKQSIDTVRANLGQIPMPVSHKLVQSRVF